MIKTIIFLVVWFQMSSFAQTNYLMKLTNPIQINSKTLEFDIIIKSTGSDFYLSSYQCSFSFNIPLTEKDSISLNYVDKSSELGNFPINVIGYDTTDGINKLIFVSGIGNDLITSAVKTVGKFKLLSTVDFAEENLQLMWNFSGSASTILTGANFSDITEPSFFQDFNNNITDLSITQKLPNHFELSQNYPNPFNPSTKINFTIPEKGMVKMTIYNMIGEKVMDLVNNTLDAGSHTITVDGSRLSSGVYVYELNVGNRYTAVKKMILLK